MDKLSRLDDYLLEYCSYGCAYFVLENKEPHRASFDKKSPVKKLNQKKESRRSVRAIANKRSFPKRERDKGQSANNSKKQDRLLRPKNNEDRQQTSFCDSTKEE